MRWLLVLALLIPGFPMPHPDNIVPSPGFEVTPDPWSYAFGGVRSTEQAYTGVYSAKILRSTLGPIIGSQTFSLANGNTYEVSARLYPDSSSTAPAQDRIVFVAVDPGDGGVIALAEVKAVNLPQDEWSHISGLSFTAVGTSGQVLLISFTTSGGFDLWYADAVEVFPVAIKLAERPVNAVVALLQAQLATELTAIDTDRADSITMVAPASGDYSAYEREVVDGKDGASHVEVFEGPIGFNDPYGTAVNRAVFDCPINIRVTYFGRIGAETLSDIRTRCRRYTAGIYNVIGQHRDLSDSDDATQLITANRVLPITEINAQKVRQIVEATVRCEEDYA